MGVEVGRAKGDVGLSLKLWDGGGGGLRGTCSYLPSLRLVLQPQMNLPVKSFR